MVKPLPDRFRAENNANHQPARWDNYKMRNVLGTSDEKIASFWLIATKKILSMQQKRADTNAPTRKS